MDAQTLQQIGGSLWEKNGMRRIYFNDLPSLFGLNVSRYNSGNISGAALDGGKISNTRAREICGALADSKIWFDLADNKFHYRVHGCRTFDGETMAAEIIDEIKRRAGGAK